MGGQTQRRVTQDQTQAQLSLGILSNIYDHLTHNHRRHSFILITPGKLVKLVLKSLRRRTSASHTLAP